MISPQFIWNEFQLVCSHTHTHTYRHLHGIVIHLFGLLYKFQSIRQNILCFACEIAAENRKLKRKYATFRYRDCIQNGFPSSHNRRTYNVLKFKIDSMSKFQKFCVGESICCTMCRVLQHNLLLCKIGHRNESCCSRLFISQSTVISTVIIKFNFLVKSRRKWMNVIDV